MLSNQQNTQMMAKAITGASNELALAAEGKGTGDGA